MSEATASQGELFAVDELRMIDRPIFQEGELERAYYEVGMSKDRTTEVVLSKVVAELVEFNGYAANVRAHLEYEIEKIKEGKI